MSGHGRSVRPGAFGQSGRDQPRSLGLGLLGLVLLGLGLWNFQAIPWRTQSKLFSEHSGRSVLVLYIFADTDPQFIENLRYFIREAVTDDNKCEYVFVIQQSPGARKNLDLPQLPSHAKYVYHANECYDWGTFGWVLRTAYVNVRKYKYFIFMNCSVRGPFLPAYARGKVHWTLPFLSRLTSNVKLVGPTISCEGSPLNGDMQGKWRRNPHVQSYVVATDRVGLKVLEDDGRIFHCHNSRWNTIYYSELGASNAVLKAGFNIDSLMTKYQGIDWRDKRNWECNRRYTCQVEHTYDGLTLDPLEVVFVKVKSFTLNNAISSTVDAVKLQEWQDKAPHDKAIVLQNERTAHPERFKLPRVLLAKARGTSCFDFDYYLAHNPDLSTISSSRAALWKHYVHFGQFEDRQHRFTCDLDYKAITTGHGMVVVHHPSGSGVTAGASNGSGGGSGSAGSAGHSHDAVLAAHANELHK